MTKGTKCLVHGCENRTNEGMFVGELCYPCHRMITSGQIGAGNTFVHAMARKIQAASGRIVEGLTFQSQCQVVEGGVYQHVKGGLYSVSDVATLEHDGSPVVVYRSCADGEVYVRHVNVFRHKFRRIRPEDVPRRSDTVTAVPHGEDR